MTHADIQESNIRLGMNEKTAEQGLKEFGEAELSSLVARKIYGNRTIYQSKPLVSRLQ
jgi:hypothetical protein